MPLVKFLNDYQGTTTNNVFYKAGQVVDLPGRMTYKLRTEGVVEKVAPSPVLEPGAHVETGAAAVSPPSAAPAVPPYKRFVGYLPDEPESAPEPVKPLSSHTSYVPPAAYHAEPTHTAAHKSASKRAASRKIGKTK